MADIGLLLIGLFSGFALRQSGKVSESALKAIGTVVTVVFLPAVVLDQVHKIARLAIYSRSGFEVNHVLAISMGWVVFAGAAFLFYWVGKKLKWSKPIIGAVILSAGLSNTSFIGFPILIWLRSESALSVAVLTDQLGSFLPLSTAGILIAAWLGNHHRHERKWFYRIFTFPPFLACLVALLTAPFQYPGFLMQILSKFSAAMMPLALVYVGAHLVFSRKSIHQYRLPVYLGLAYKLILAPMVLAIFFRFILGIQNQAIDIGLLEVAMAPMISSAFIANEYDCEAELCHLMIALGTPLSFITVPLISILIR